MLLNLEKTKTIGFVAINYMINYLEIDIQDIMIL
jgi:hypothetical protein